MIRSKNNKLGFVAIFVSCIFFFNANISIIDLLPDFIGYIILSFALTKLSDMSEEIAQAKKLFWYMIFVDLSKYLALFWIFGYSRDAEQSNSLLLATFVYAILEVLVLSMAFGKLFDGLCALGYANPNTSILGCKREGKSSYTDKIKIFTVFFIVVKSTVCLLPELTVLPTAEYNYSSLFMYLYESIAVMRILSVLLSSIFGITWLCKILGYFRRVNKDREFISSLYDKYEAEIAPKTSIHIKRRVRRAFMCFIAATVFLFDLRLEEFNMLPDALSAVFFAIGFVIIFKEAKKKAFFIASVSLHFVTSLIYQTYEIYFFENYYYAAVYRSPEVYTAYCIKCALGVIPILAFALSALAMIYLLRGIIVSHTGYSGREQVAHDVIVAFHKQASRKLYLFGACALLLIATDSFYLFGTIKFGFSGLLCFIGNLIFLIASLKVYSEISEDIETKYMLD